MAFHVRDSETDAKVRALAKRLGVGLTEAVNLAVSDKLDHHDPKVPLRDRLRKIAEPLGAYPETGLNADKAFFDSLSGDD